MTQNQALDILKTGQSIFLTGEPGSGKTYTINAFIQYLKSHKIEPAITASTGIAATHINGRTIHSWSGIGIKKFLSKKDLEKISYNRFVRRRIEQAKVLIIEEISMLSANTLDMVDTVCKEIRSDQSPFGGLQVIFVGDFFQLPPVQSEEDKEPVSFAFQSQSWENLNPTVCYLTEQFRQDDQIFLSLLSAIRTASHSSEHQRHLFQRVDSKHSLRSDLPRLFAHNAQVDLINSKELAKLPTQAKDYKMNVSGNPKDIETLQRGCLSPELLSLKVGATVMCTKNNPERGFINGTLGTVEDFEKESNFPIIRTQKRQKITMEPMEWAIEENDKIKARISQIPLKLAWAITIHKSQGMTMDAAVIDLSQSFEFGQGYVALSRVRRLSGLYLLGFNQRALEVHPQVIFADKEFKHLSAQSLKELEILSENDLRSSKEKLIKKYGGKFLKNNADDIDENSLKSKSWLQKQREKFSNAYKPWSGQDDDTLKILFQAGAKTKELSKAFKRNNGAIRSRLKKLKLVED